MVKLTLQGEKCNKLKRGECKDTFVSITGRRGVRGARGNTTRICPKWKPLPVN